MISWDSGYNKITLISRMPTIYSSPGDDRPPTDGQTRYVVPVGKGFFFDGEDGPRILDISDGTANTIMAVEADADHAVIWTKPEDLEIDLEHPLKGLAGSRIGGFFAALPTGGFERYLDDIDASLFLKLLTSAAAKPWTVSSTASRSRGCTNQA